MISSSMKIDATMTTSWLMSWLGIHHLLRTACESLGHFRGTCARLGTHRFVIKTLIYRSELQSIFPPTCSMLADTGHPTCRAVIFAIRYWIYCRRLAQINC